MEYRHLKKWLIASIVFGLIGCNSMNINHQKEKAEISFYTKSDLVYISTNEYFGYQDQQSYYVILDSSESSYENRDKFKIIGRFLSNDPNDKLQIKWAERFIKNHSNKNIYSDSIVTLKKDEKIYTYPIKDTTENEIKMRNNFFINANKIKEKLYSQHTDCEYCFEPSVDILKNGEDYTFNLKLKNMGSNDFDLEGISELTKPKGLLSSPVLSIFFEKELIELDKSNLLNNNYLDKITILKNETVIIPFVIHSHEIPKSIRNKDLTKEKLTITMLSKYKSGELSNNFYKFTLYNK